jgi:predicted nucleotidyltransferase
MNMGLLSRNRHDRRVVYSRNAGNPQWRAIDSLVREFAPTLLLRDALRSLPGVRAAFVFGSVARGDARADSDIDVLICADALPDRALGAVLLDLALLVDRKLDIKRYDSAGLRREAKSRASFLRAALAGPKIWLIGSAGDLPVRVRKTA